MVRKRNPKGSGSITENGYIRIVVEGRRYYMHRLIMQKAIGRELTDGEEVHHKNGNRIDNRIENLEIVQKGKHLSMHHRKYHITDDKKQCSQCKKLLLLSEYYKRNTLLGYSSCCKECNKKKCREWKQKSGYIFKKKKI